VRKFSGEGDRLSRVFPIDLGKELRIPILGQPAFTGKKNCEGRAKSKAHDPSKD
jgi:hypothetical protein